MHAADPAYLSFERDVLPIAVQRGMGIQGMKSTANAKLLKAISVRDCLSYALSLPIHCVALGCTNVTEVEQDVRVAQQFRPMGQREMAELRGEVAHLGGPTLEDWKRSRENVSSRSYRDGVPA